MTQNKANHRTLEVILILISAALTCVLYQMTGYGIIVLNLFFLPVALAAFYLGRYRAGVLAFFNVITASIVTALHLEDFAGNTSPLVIGLSVVVWGGVLGLMALMVGTLSDELSSRMVELHEAYVGVVDVLAQYLQSGNPRLKDRSHRIAELCQEVAQQMKLSPREVDDIRVAALLHDIENIEVTARVIRKAMGDLTDEQKGAGQHTFHGTELVHSLGPVLLGAFPLVLNQAEPEQQHSMPGHAPAENVPLVRSDHPHRPRLRRAQKRQMGPARSQSSRRDPGPAPRCGGEPPSDDLAGARADRLPAAGRRRNSVPLQQREPAHTRRRSLRSPFRVATRPRTAVDRPEPGVDCRGRANRPAPIENRLSPWHPLPRCLPPRRLDEHDAGTMYFRRARCSSWFNNAFP